VTNVIERRRRMVGRKEKGSVAQEKRIRKVEMDATVLEQQNAGTVTYSVE